MYLSNGGEPSPDGNGSPIYFDTKESIKNRL